jgi:diacylglycerol kinase (ATP)
VRGEGRFQPPATRGDEGVAFLVNPRAASGGAGRLWEELLAAEPRLAGATVVSAGEPTAAAAALDAALAAARAAPPDRARGAPPGAAPAAGLRRLVVVGGDGSVHLAANRLLAGGRGREVELALVPAGTGSDLARAVGLPAEPRAALALALDGAARPLDALRVATAAETRWALCVASAGISGVVDQLVNARPVRRPTAYLTATLAALRRYRPFRAAVEADGEAWYEGEVFLLAAANTHSFGKGMRIAPAAAPDDGLADLVLVQPLPGWRVPLELPRLYLGAHLGRPYVAFRRARRMRLAPAGDLPPFDLDGEPMPSGPATFELVPGALRFVR